MIIKPDNHFTIIGQLIHSEKKITRTTAYLARMKTMIDWIPLVKIVGT